MTCTEIAHPRVGTIAGDHWLLRLAQEWRTLIQWHQWQDIKDDIAQTISAITSYLYQMERQFGREQDYFHLRGQDNLLRYRPIADVVIRLHQDDTLFATLARCAAATIAGCAARLSVPPGLTNRVTAFLDSHHGRRFLHGMVAVRQNDAELAALIPTIGRLRYAGPERVPVEIFSAAAKTGVWIASTPVYMEGQIELLYYLQQQTICNNYHRYGNLGTRSLD